MKVCPNCGSDKATAQHVQVFMVNTGEHYCHATKTQDPYSESECHGCSWIGTVAELNGDYEDE